MFTDRARIIPVMRNVIPIMLKGKGYFGVRILLQNPPADGKIQIIHSGNGSKFLGEF